jgi:hypothetical protein
MKKINIVVDTSIFVNPDSRVFFGQTPQKAWEKFLDYSKKKKNVFCFMPPSVYEEFLNFLEKDLSSKEKILIHKKPPSSYQIQIPALFLYEFIEEMRSRINKGLRIAEKYTRKAKKEKEEKLIKSLREEYRTALREGIIDSKQDFDLILLAKEIKGLLATSDQGLVKWAQKLGITCISSQELKALITDYK